MRVARLHRPNPEPASAEPARLADARHLDVRGAHGEAYRLFVAIPEGPPPPGGFPVIYLLDGNALFATAVDAAQLQARRHDVTGVDPAIIVGIGYPIEVPFDDAWRRRDLLPDAGGADRFVSFIEKTVKPTIVALAPVDVGRHALVGHSFGGLFALHVLFTRPELFRSYVAGSPSIWWNYCAVHGSEARFRASAAGGLPPRLLITVGSDEQSGDARTNVARAERLRLARMVDNAAEMAGRLENSGRVELAHAVFAGENHISVIPAMLARAVSFAVAGTVLQDRTS